MEVRTLDSEAALERALELTARAWREAFDHVLSDDELDRVERALLSDVPERYETLRNGSTWTVLVAEDDPVNARLIETLLTRAGHAVTVVGDGAGALAAAAESAYDLVLVDLRMPGMDGAELARRLRERDGAEARMPIVVLTANAAEDSHKFSVETTVANYESAYRDVL